MGLFDIKPPKKSKKFKPVMPIFNPKPLNSKPIKTNFKLKPVSFVVKSNKSNKPKMKNLIFGYDHPKPARKVKGKLSMTWPQAKKKFPKLNPLGDRDRDGVQNFLDCRPFDKKRQGWTSKDKPKRLSPSARKMIDPGIRKHMGRVAKAGFETCASCSGLKKEHKDPASPYLSVVVPERYAKRSMASWSNPHDVPHKDVKEFAPIKRLIKEGEKAGWKGEFGKYMMTTPTVTFRLPETKSVKADKMMKKDPRLVKVNMEIQSVMGKSDSTDFMKKIDERHEIEKELHKEYGKSRPHDITKERAWDKLTTHLEKVDLEKEYVKPEVLVKMDLNNEKDEPFEIKNTEGWSATTTRNGRPATVKRVKINKQFVSRFVDDKSGKVLNPTKSGVDDPDSAFLKEEGKYPQQQRGHKEFLEKHGENLEDLYEEEPVKEREPIEESGNDAQELLDEIEEEEQVELDKEDEEKDK